MAKNVGEMILTDDVALDFTTSNLKTSREPDTDTTKDPRRMGGNTHLNVSGVSKTDGKDCDRIIQEMVSDELKREPRIVTL